MRLDIDLHARRISKYGLAFKVDHRMGYSRYKAISSDGFEFGANTIKEFYDKLKLWRESNEARFKDAHRKES